ncbi:MAG: hypothetical protein ACE5FA_08745 [Dehalococcoidia bacterium]
MILVQRTIEFADLTKQTETYWWASNSLRGGHHSGAYWVLRVLRKCGKTELLRCRATEVLVDKGYAEHVAAADW